VAKKTKSLAQLPFGSKEWDDEMTRQHPGWAGVHASLLVLKGFPLSETRKKRLKDYPTEPLVTPSGVNR
jgi:hypothetical protein